MVNLEKVKDQIVRILRNNENKDWINANLTIQFPPFINEGNKTLPSFLDKDRNRVRAFSGYDDEFNNVIFAFIKEVNKTKVYNQINFSTERDKYDEAKIEVVYNQQIVDDFEVNLPKSLRGKTKAWYAPITLP